MLRAIASALLPAMATDTPPPWLRPGQADAFRRAMAAVRHHGGAMLAEPVGTGKTWIALGVALAVEPEPPVILTPAVLVPQWRTVVHRLGIEAQLHSHEAISRGRLPTRDAGVVILDESHWFRNPSTRRYRSLAPWLVGRRGLLLSATPMVNRAADLAHQLRLFLRDDSLAAGGLASLRALGERHAQVHALGDVVVTGWAETGSRPALVRHTERLRLDRRLGQVLRELDRLGLSTDPTVAALVRTSLWGAAASSPAALAAALLRYLVLLDHAADAAQSGRPLGREALRRFMAADPAQLVLWHLMPDDAAGTADLTLADRPRVAALRTEVAAMAERTDSKAARLKQRLSDGHRTVVFTGAVATVAYLRRILGSEPVAWCTGAAAGIGATRLPREAVLGWFAPGARLPRSRNVALPRVLVTTDVAAEGLDLQGAERVVHYDLPWTVIRTDQRTGRVRRLESTHSHVSEDWFLPPRALARRLRVEGILARKRLLPDRLGVGEGSAAPWRQRIRVARALAGEPAVDGIAAVRVTGAGDDDALACVRIEVGGGRGTARLFVHHRRRGWRADDADGLVLLERLASGAPAPEPARPTIDALVESLAVPVREVMRRSTGAAWEPGWQTVGSLVLLRRLRYWARIAARARDARLLERLDTAVRGLGRGQTAGEEVRLAELAAREDASLLEHLRLLPAPGPTLTLPTVRLVGMIVVAGE